ncbi:MAG: restriction endonuclease [Micromonosporaceae bacterium]
MARRSSGWQDWQRQQSALAREQQRQRREGERIRVAAEKERQRLYREQREQQIADKNTTLEHRVGQLQGILLGGLGRSAVINLWAAQRQTHIPPLDLGSDEMPVPQPVWEQFAPRRPGAISRAFGGEARHQRRLNAAKEEFERAARAAIEQETARQRRVVAARREREQRIQRAEADARAFNEALEEHIRRIEARSKDDVEQHLSQVFQRVPLPDDFPRNAEVTFNPRTEQAVVRFQLPTGEVIPADKSYRYLSTKDEERATQRPKREVDDLYRSVVSQVALLCVRDLFDSDKRLAEVAFNGHAYATNPATGEREYPCLISLNVSREKFPRDENLREVRPEACVRHLQAVISPHPYELEPIEPLLDFDLSKFSFVDGFDAVSTLDSRPDLMQMTPTNFEHLVRQVFEAQGCEGWTTTESHDDGVDAVIARRTAIVGGLSIVQAKRYRGVVGVSHVRELAGAMEEKKAGWGILVTTSWFTDGCWKKARDHGRMELIDGERLVYLIKEHLGKDVLIGIPKRPRPRGPRSS